MKTARLLADLRALGSGAPIRVAYELSKRTGFHAFLFRGAPAKLTPRFRSPLQLPPDIPPAARGRALLAAAKIVSGEIEIFGEKVTVDSPPDWHQVIHDRGSWPLQPWWKIDIRSPERLGDVKWAWELGRHRQLVLLARAAYLEPTERRYRQLLETHLTSWLDQNPPEVGIHWYSNLEIALRGIAWLQILSLAGDQLDPSTVTRMHGTLYLMGRHLIVDLPYSVSTMRNNHLIGDGVGMVALGSAFPDNSAAQRWRWAGDRLLEHQILRHFRGDGSSIEDSISYNRFVLEMLAMRVILGDASDTVVNALSRSARFLMRLGLLEGPLPQFGDWDEGRVLAVAERPNEMVGSVRLALALTGNGAPMEWSGEHDEVAWYAGNGTPETPPQAVSNGSDVGGGIGRVHAGKWTAWLKAGSAPSHGHADLLSTPILYGTRWVVGDPGTGTYNGPIEQRNYFRSSLAHSVTRVGRLDQLEPHRVFRWRHKATGTLGKPVAIDNLVIMWGIHDAYERLNPPRRVARVVALSNKGVVVGDWVEGSPPIALSLSLPLSPDADWDDGKIRFGDRTSVRCWASDDIECVMGSSEPFDGWWSDTYGSIVPAPRLNIESDQSPIAFSIASDDQAHPKIMSGGKLAWADLVLEVQFQDSEVHLVVSSATSRHERTIS